MIGMRAVVVLVALVTGCLSKPPRPSGDPGDGGLDGDARPGTGPRVIASLGGSRAAASSLTTTIEVPDRPDRYLLATVQVGSDCATVAPSTILAQVEDADGTLHPLMPIASISGTPCGQTSRSELWELRAPPAGGLEVTVALDGIAMSLHGAAIVFAGIDQTTPTRAPASASGEGAFTSVEVAAEAGDLVLTTVGHGTTIETPGPLQKELFLVNHGTSTTLDNSSASTAPGAALVTTTFEAVGVDQWQTIAVPLRSSGR